MQRGGAEQNLCEDLFCFIGQNFDFWGAAGGKFLRCQRILRRSLSRSRLRAHRLEVLQVFRGDFLQNYNIAAIICQKFVHLYAIHFIFGFKSSFCCHIQCLILLFLRIRALAPLELPIYILGVQKDEIEIKESLTLSENIGSVNNLSGSARFKELEIHFLPCSSSPSR